MPLREKSLNDLLTDRANAAREFNVIRRKITPVTDPEIVGRKKVLRGPAQFDVRIGLLVLEYRLSTVIPGFGADHIHLIFHQLSEFRVGLVVNVSPITVFIVSADIDSIWVLRKLKDV